MPARRTRSRRSCLRSTSHCTWTGGSPIPTRWSRRRRSPSPRSLPPTRATCASPPPSTSRAPRPTLWAVRSRVCRCTLHPHPHPRCTSTSTSTPASTSTLHQHLHATSCIWHRTTCISHRALPRMQLETVAYACQRHNSTTLRGGERGGFFLGDGVGLGKGRQLAAIVYAAACRPRRPIPHTRPCRLPRASPRTAGPTPTPAAQVAQHAAGPAAGCALQQRAVWLSVSRDLGVDARRDLDDIDATETRTRTRTRTRTLILTLALTLTQGRPTCRSTT